MIIYGLTDPRDKQLRYVGKTSDGAKRLRTHLLEARRGRDTYLYRWIRVLLSEGLKPTFSILETVEPEQANERERALIAHFRREGFPLTNRTDGGDGGATMKGKKFTPEHRRRISEANKGHAVSEENRRKSGERLSRLLREGRAGRPFPKGQMTGKPFPRGVQSSPKPFRKGQKPHNRIELDETRLFDLYVNQKMTTDAIGKIFGVSGSMISRRVCALGFARSRSEAHSLENLTRERMKTSATAGNMTD